MAQHEKISGSEVENIPFEVEVLPWASELLEPLSWESEMLPNAEQRLTELLNQFPSRAEFFDQLPDSEALLTELLKMPAHLEFE